MNWNFSSSENINALLLVAHPDDETIFCGGTMLYYSNCEWTVVCVTEGPGNAPLEEFEKAMNHFKDLGVNIKSYIWGKQRKFKKGMSEEDENILKSEWKAFLEQQKFSPDMVFTHSERGEYGHKDHILLNEVAKHLYSNVWEFICPGASNCSQPYKNEIKVVPLNGEILKKKTDIFNYCYTSQLYNWRGDLSNVMLYEFKTGPEIFTSN